MAVITITFVITGDIRRNIEKDESQKRSGDRVTRTGSGNNGKMRNSVKKGRVPISQ